MWNSIPIPTFHSHIIDHSLWNIGMGVEFLNNVLFLVPYILIIFIFCFLCKTRGGTLYKHGKHVLNLPQVSKMTPEWHL